MASLSRRNFLQAGGAAAASAAVLAGPLAHGTASAAPGSTGHGSPDVADADLVPTGSDHLVMVVHDASTGEVSVLTHGHEVVFHDPQLVARVQRASRKAQ